MGLADDFDDLFWRAEMDWLLAVERRHPCHPDNAHLYDPMTDSWSPVDG